MAFGGILMLGVAVHVLEVLAVVAATGLLGTRSPDWIAPTLGPLLVLVAALNMYCLIDLGRAPAVRYLPKPFWAMIILLGSSPFGALAYLLFGNPGLRRASSGGR